jgi:polar amino acid transport system substrate-binding protein
MTDLRRRVGVLAAGAATVALVATPLAALAQDEAMAGVSEACQAANLDGMLKNPGRLTLSTDIPAYGPWWGGDPDTQYEFEPEGGSGWEVSDPYSGEGYESATAYAVAAALGFGPDQVDWAQNTVFELAFAPGEKAFDWHMAQTSIRPERAENVDFSDPYFDANQSLLAMTANDAIMAAATVEDLKDLTLGAAVGTTSLQLIEEFIQPNTDPQVFSDNIAAMQALAGGLIDGMVLDLNSAFFMRDAQLEDWDTPEPEGTIVGQFAVTAQEDKMGMVMEKGNPLLACVNEAIAAITDSGQLQEIYDREIASAQDIPTFE